MPSASFHNPYKNKLLASLPPETIQKLSPHLLPVDLPRYLPLYEPMQPIEFVYFLERGVCSIMATMQDGTTVEAGLIGREGFVGMPAVLGTISSPFRTFMHIAGDGFRVKARTLKEQFDASAALRSCLLRGVHGALVQAAQTAACNRVHDLHERLARWLLMCRDRVQTDHIPITQELLAIMLGTRRSSVTVAAGILQKAGLITHTRGRVTILNHSGLANAACECYRVVHGEAVRLGLLD
ncbi:MAG: Crp/Fnr family transcriptional regulator [Terracidiphilus sp.]|jgi:CRP-like cAMP-binding protein